MSVYAVIQTGGKQYKVQAGEMVVVEQLAGNPGDTVSFDDVLLVANDGVVTLGKPTLEGAQVTGEIVGAKTGDKVIVYKFRRRKDYRRKRGHRQMYTAVRIREVVAPS